MDKKASAYAGQDSMYCNDPVAINYNRDFPGTANNMICVYPTDPFIGMYAIADSVYTEDFADYYIINDTINIYAVTKTNMAVIGFCGPLDSIKLTANRYYKASIDSTIQNGQPLCSIKDTISGLFSVDSLKRVHVNFTSVSEAAGIKYHRGTATRIQ